eukprot:m.246007 g.246007  ORF g.246007 m.246007 type:complete len:62 (+) comp19482_c0_seq1:83-268(+)
MTVLLVTAKNHVRQQRNISLFVCAFLETCNMPAAGTATSTRVPELHSGFASEAIHVQGVRD